MLSGRGGRRVAWAIQPLVVRVRTQVHMKLFQKETVSKCYSLIAACGQVGKDADVTKLLQF